MSEDGRIFQLKYLEGSRRERFMKKLLKKQKTVFFGSKKNIKRKRYGTRYRPRYARKGRRNLKRYKYSGRRRRRGGGGGGGRSLYGAISHTTKVLNVVMTGQLLRYEVEKYPQRSSNIGIPSILSMRMELKGSTNIKDGYLCLCRIRSRDHTSISSLDDKRIMQCIRIGSNDDGSIIVDRSVTGIRTESLVIYSSMGMKRMRPGDAIALLLVPLQLNISGPLKISKEHRGPDTSSSPSPLFNSNNPSSKRRKRKNDEREKEESEDIINESISTLESLPEGSAWLYARGTIKTTFMISNK